MQPVSLSPIQDGYRVNSIRGNDARMPRRERAYIENYEQNGESLAKAYRNAVLMANLKDEQLLQLAKADANRDNKYKVNTYTAALIGIPIMDTFVSGAFAKAPKLSGKLSTMGRVAAGWGGAFALAGLYNGMVNKVTAVSPVVRKFEEKHPVIKSLLTLAGFAAVLIGAQKGISKATQSLSKKLPKIAEGLSKLKTDVADTINNSKFNEKVAQPLKEKLVKLAEKHPRTATAAVSGLALSVPFMLAGSLFKFFTDKSEKAEQSKDMYKQLVAAREINRQIVNKINNKIVDDSLVNIANAVAANEITEAKEDKKNTGVNADEDEYDSDNGYFD